MLGRMLVSLTADDWPIWRDVRLAALADSSPEVVEDWTRLQESTWRDRLLDPTGLCLAVLSDGAPVGVVRGSLENQWAWLSSLWVAGSHRGQGLGKELMVAVEKWARQHARVLLLCVAPDNHFAIGMYRRHGFIDSGMPGQLQADGQRELVLRKRLT